MRRSTDRILTTHVGALPAPDDVWAQLEVSDQRLGEAVTEVCDMQTSAGVDFINEGELTKGGHWTQYLAARLGGYEPAAERGAAEAQQRMEDFVKRRTAAAEAKIAQAETQAMAEVRAAAADAAIQVSEAILRERMAGDAPHRLEQGRPDSAFGKQPVEMLEMAVLLRRHARD